MVSSSTVSSGPSYQQHSRQNSSSTPYHNPHFPHRPDSAAMHSHPLKQPQHHYLQGPPQFQQTEQTFPGYPGDMMMDPYQPPMHYAPGPGAPPPPQSRGHGRTPSYTHSRSGSTSSVGGFPNQPMPVMPPNDNMQMHGQYRGAPEHPSWSPSLAYAQHPQQHVRRSVSPAAEQALHQRPIHHPHPYHMAPAPPTRPSSRSRSHSRSLSHSQPFPQQSQPQYQQQQLQHQQSLPQGRHSSPAYHPSSYGPEEIMHPVERPAEPVRPLVAAPQEEQTLAHRTPVVMVEEEEDDGEILGAQETRGAMAPLSGEETLDSSKCLDCGKVYKHANCLLKHRWEHSVYWKPAAKFLLSKHQQVQLMEAAAILLGMDDSRELDSDHVVSTFTKQRGHLATVTSIASVSPPSSTKSFSASPSPRTAERRALAHATVMETRPRGDILEVPQHHHSSQQQPVQQPQHPVYQGSNGRVKGSSTRHSVTSTTSTASSLSSTPPSLAPDDESVVEMDDEIRSSRHHLHQQYPYSGQQHGMMVMDMPPPPPMHLKQQHMIEQQQQQQAPYYSHDPRYPPFHHQHQLPEHHVYQQGPPPPPQHFGAPHYYQH
ncbi:hypothetical protein EMPS_06923 [Entomortierella parvispora]|uniref:C2H2-type domain-containing protein n=1 Tax=Entomortierella parvispora TaxID=205924 RepID=A0A9P3HD65_9FUNG|nr:hypothetical protein EMPS_06923 [Entomortierella parvispora]